MSQSAADLLKQLQDQKLRLFTTGDVKTLTSLSSSAATQALRRLSSHGLLTSLKRGLWANRLVNDLDPLEAIPHLTAPWPGYVSLYSALSRYGLIDEVPQTVFGISAGRAKRYRTELGNFQIHHLPKHLMWGFTMARSGRSSFPMAEPEKAFLDLAYLSLIPRSGLGKPYKRDRRWNFDRKKLARYAKAFHFPPLRIYLKTNNLI